MAGGDGRNDALREAVLEEKDGSSSETSSPPGQASHAKPDPTDESRQVALETALDEHVKLTPDGSPLDEPALANPSTSQFTPAPRDQGAVLEEAPGEDVKLTLEGFTLDEITLVNSSMLPYLAMVASVIERRMISSDELLYVLRRSMRQRSFDRLPRREYVLRFLNQHPP